MTTNKVTEAADEIMSVTAESTGGAGAEAVVPGLGNVVSTFAIVGSSTIRSRLINITNLNLSTNTPAVVMLQPRQADNQDFGFPDEFTVQVIKTSAKSILCRILRTDANSGWGQNLRLDLFIVDNVLNP
jgi:hypothetical protein